MKTRKEDPAGKTDYFGEERRQRDERAELESKWAACMPHDPDGFGWFLIAVATVFGVTVIAAVLAASMM